MSYDLTAWALRQEIASPTRKFVLVAVANAANHETGDCFPSISAISKVTSLSVPTVKRALADLVGDGLLRRARRKRPNGSLSTYLYEFPHRDERGSERSHATAPDSPAGITVNPSTGIAVIPRNKEGLNKEVIERANALSTPGRAPALVKVDGRNLPYDALADETGADPRTESGRIAKALKTIRQVAIEDLGLDGAASSPEVEEAIAGEIRRRAALYRQRWPEVELTPTALAANWSRVLNVKSQPRRYGRGLTTREILDGRF